MNFTVKMNWSILPILLLAHFIFSIEQAGLASALNSKNNGVQKYSRDLSFQSRPRRTPTMRTLNASPSTSLSGGSIEPNDGKQGISSAAFNLVKAWCAKIICFLLSQRSLLFTQTIFFTPRGY